MVYDLVLTIPGIIALVALAQPWLILLYKKLVRPLPAFDINGIELGYSALGSTMSVLGVIHCNSGSVYVRKISARVTREKNHSIREFKWTATKSLKLFPEPADYFAVTGCLVTAGAPVPIHLFMNSAFEQSASVSEFRVRALQLVDGKESILEEAVGGTTDVDPVWKSLIAQPVTIEALNALNRAFFWDESKYSATITLHLADGRTIESTKFAFAVTEHDSKRMFDNNPSAILMELAELEADYQFCFPELEPI